jgi:hypothetical protein
VYFCIREIECSRVVISRIGGVLGISTARINVSKKRGWCSGSRNLEQQPANGTTKTELRGLERR